jgi:hypothetical protein
MLGSGLGVAGSGGLRRPAEGALRGDELNLHGEAATSVLRQWRVAVEEASLPKHLAIIPDGNRRWAAARGMPSSFGHLKGKDRMNEVADDPPPESEKRQAGPLIATSVKLNSAPPNFYWGKPQTFLLNLVGVPFALCKYRSEFSHKNCAHSCRFRAEFCRFLGELKGTP